MVLASQFWLYLGAVLAFIVPGRRLRFVVFVPLVFAIVDILGTDYGKDALLVKFFDHACYLFAPNEFTKFLLLSFSALVVLLAIYGYHRANKLEYLSFFLYAGSAFGIITAKDYLILLVDFELLAVAACLILLSAKTVEGQRISSFMHYSVIHFLSGIIMLIGVGVKFSYFGNPEILKLGDLCMSLSDSLILSSLLINCAAFPFSAWVFDCYAAATEFGVVVLQSFTTKVSLYILLLLFQGNELLIYIGILTAIYSIVCSIGVVSARRINCYNVVGQVGLVLMAIGLQNKLATSGIVLQIAFCAAYQCALYIIHDCVDSLKRCDREFGVSKNSYYYSLLMFNVICAIIMVSFPGTSTFFSKSVILDAANGLELKWLSNLSFYWTFTVINLILYALMAVRPFFIAFFTDNISSETSYSVKENTDFSAIFCIIVLVLVNILFPAFADGVVSGFSDLVGLSDILKGLYSPAGFVKQFILVLLATAVFCYTKSYFLDRFKVLKLDVSSLYKSFLPRLFVLGALFCTFVDGIVSKFYVHLKREFINVFSGNSSKFVSFSALGCVEVNLFFCLFVFFLLLFSTWFSYV